jgi:hypothetical protein
MVLALACLVWLGSWSASGRAATQDTSAAKGGVLLPNPSITAVIQGRLEKLTGWNTFIDKFGWVIQADGQHFYVDFEGNKELLEKALKLHGKFVRLEAFLDVIEYDPRLELLFPVAEGRSPNDKIPTVLRRANVLRVTSLDSVESPDAKDEVRVEIIGPLKLKTATGACTPIINYEITVGRQTYHLQLDADWLREKAAANDGKRVSIRGSLKDGVVKVTALTELKDVVIG